MNWGFFSHGHASGESLSGRRSGRLYVLWRPTLENLSPRPAGAGAAIRRGAKARARTYPEWAPGRPKPSLCLEATPRRRLPADHGPRGSPLTRTPPLLTPHIPARASRHRLGPPRPHAVSLTLCLRSAGSAKRDPAGYHHRCVAVTPARGRLAVPRRLVRHPARLDASSSAGRVR